MPARPRPAPGPADAADPASPAVPELGELDRAILALESRTFRYVGTKERAIREELALSKVAYYVRLHALLEEPAALRAAPALVHRLRSRREEPEPGQETRGSGRVA